MKGEGWLLEAGGEGNGEFLPNGYKVSLWDDEKKIFFFRMAPTAYGNSQAKGRIRVVVASLHHSHSNTRSKLHL